MHVTTVALGGPLDVLIRPLEKAKEAKRYTWKNKCESAEY